MKRIAKEASFACGLAVFLWHASFPVRAICVALVCLLGFGSFAEAQTNRLPVIMTLVVDRSGSMDPNAPIGACLSNTRGGLYLPAAVTQFINTFDESLDRAALVSFSVSSSNDVPMSPMFGAFKTPIINTLNRFNNNNLWQGSTCSIAGLTNALVIQNTVSAPANAVKVVVFFTDGLANMTFGKFNGVPLNFGGQGTPQVGCPPFPDAGASFWRTNTSEQSQVSVCSVNCGSAMSCSINGTNLTAQVFTNAHGLAEFICASKITEDATNRCVLIANQMRASSNYVYVVGLSAPGALDSPTLTTLQQIANDPNSPTFDPTQPVGAALLSDGSDLTNVFRQVATNIITRPPWINCPSAVTVNTDTEKCTASNVNLGTPLAGARCSGPLTLSNNAPAVFSKGTTLVVWAATDACGNGTTCTQSVTVVDNQLPTIVCPAPLAVSCAAAVPSPNPASITASDNCGSVTMTFVSDTITNQSCPDRYTVLRTYRATDAANNSVTCTQTITVNATTSPTITAPGDVTISTDSGQCYASGVALGSPVTTSPCDGVLTITNNAPVVFPKGSTPVIWSAMDSCGNSASATQNVLVADHQPPLVACPANIVVNAQDTNGAVVAFSVTAADNCDSNVTVICSPVSGSEFALGTTAVNCTVVDSVGNTNTCSFNITVVDPSIFTILSITPQSSDILLAWVMPLGLTGVVQGSVDTYGDDFTNVSGPFYLTGSGIVTNNYIDVGGQTNFPQRFYRIRLLP
jgi:HYR domain